jgi:hypothetical protein
MRYFIKIPDIECAETDDAAARLIARGYKECGRAYYMIFWQLRHDARMAELIARAWRASNLKERTVGE